MKTKAPAKEKESTLSVTLKRSAIGRPRDQKATLVGLGFKRLNQTVVLKDTPQARGMIKKVSHLVMVD
ncbi:MAG: 50S ribosomal protein L30 [Deltaproteobacteria bacterium]|nr:50S ribosomal protein L30 [Deltaproteobacteria bacterium]